MDNCLSDSELKLHPLLQIFFVVEPVVPAPHATGGSVGDILSAVRPADIVALTTHECDELLPGCGRTAYTRRWHMVQSFPADEKVDPTVAHAAALKLAEWFQGREVLVCTHVDRDHVHSHFLVDSVSFEEGKKLHISEPELAQLRQRNDQVCMEFGLPVFQPQKRTSCRPPCGTAAWCAGSHRRRSPDGN